MLIAVSIPFDVAAAVILRLDKNKKPEEDHLPWQIILFRFCPRIAVATLIQPLLARIKQKPDIAPQEQYQVLPTVAVTIRLNHPER
ncbi:hypothetical protein IE978_11165 [Klebsiella pneumoniae]|uniref:Uncharacterized protein n=1 Tax=Klebsiella pneumoniae TaxID=573 RepID=A0A927E0E7_KLEPN|nr:hypothetical protein [Klebsiella pneumoniae]